MKQKKHLAIVGSMLLALTACSGGSSELDPTCFYQIIVIQTKKCYENLAVL